MILKAAFPILPEGTPSNPHLRQPEPHESTFFFLRAKAHAQLCCNPLFWVEFGYIFMGELFLRNAAAQEMRKWGPAVRPVVHQQALRWDNILHSLNVAVIVF